MLDSYGRIPQAITQGNIVDLGTMGQCLDIYEVLEDVTIQGRYCFGGLIVPLGDIINSTSPVKRVMAKVPFGFNARCFSCSPSKLLELASSRTRE